MELAITYHFYTSYYSFLNYINYVKFFKTLIFIPIQVVISLCVIGKNIKHFKQARNKKNQLLMIN